MKYKKNYKLFAFFFALILNSVPALKAELSPENVRVDHAVVIDTPSKSSVSRDKKLFDQAVQYSMQDQWAQAEKIYRDLIKRHPLWPETKNNLAVVLLKMEKQDEARTFLESAVISSPSYRIAQQNRTLLYNFLANQAYNKVLDTRRILQLPELELILKIEGSGVVEKQVMDETSEIHFKETVQQIEQQLNAWSRAWSEGRFEQYIQFYSLQFTPVDNQKTFAQWKQDREFRLDNAQGVKVGIDQVRVFFEHSIEKEDEDEEREAYVLVEFLQYYQSANYKDTVLKQVYMHKQNKQWLIVSERTLKTL
ncbi:MAG TPA: hypothetical protein ENJ08_13415 [Gammaproteobacteria bacterium]|nr:hypothetical protein [Gammaproteobacteria bacterium]